MKLKGWRAPITSHTAEVTSMNGVTISRQKPLGFANEADAVLIGSGVKTLDIAKDPNLLAKLALDPTRQLIGAQCSGTLILARLGLIGALPACTDLRTLQRSPGWLRPASVFWMRRLSPTATLRRPEAVWRRSTWRCGLSLDLGCWRMLRRRYAMSPLTGKRTPMSPVRSQLCSPFWSPNKPSWLSDIIRHAAIVLSFRRRLNFALTDGDPSSMPVVSQAHRPAPPFGMG